MSYLNWVIPSHEVKAIASGLRERAATALSDAEILEKLGQNVAAELLRMRYEELVLVITDLERVIKLEYERG